ncbi:MAG TPA: phosphoenolpyruvate carboxylase [Dokdonella sp.]|uniref:phosphoenolpyruvate carboxylase n=1 Tax=Dokdonella sp. TaxID=2291710 RepID=UPI002BEA3F63|nr:phosphoenolpyruvate carboxylase [Dokdonella sp.]HUD40925.1 phosphoenolpyruvate carboxylase [Dokdonella sp.]
MNADTRPAADSLRSIDLPETDQPLREDVNRVGSLVGEIIAEQEGEAFFEEVERIRIAAIARREAGDAAAALERELAGADVAHATALVRAFSTYFQAVNVAERVHRIRRRRAYEMADAEPQPGGLRHALRGLAGAGVTPGELAACLSRLRIEPVLTAHPTEAVRRALLEKERELVRALIADIDGNRTPVERRADLERMRLSLTAAWQTAELALEKPTVADELEHVGFYLTDVLYRVVPVFYEVFADALAEFGPDAADTVLPAVLGFGTWVGGDMDGNPNVGAETIAATLSSQRAQVLALYRRDVLALSSLLSQSLSRVPCSADVLARIDVYRALLPEAAARLKSRQQDMPYRQLLQLVAERLAETERGREGGYPDAATFAADIGLVADSLRLHRGEHAGGFAVRRLLRRAQTFGFHLATLDLRQDSAVHEAALAALLGDADWAARPVGERVERLGAVLDDPAAIAASSDDTARRTLAVLRTVAELRPRYGARAFGPYIVSMSRSAADALAVLALARIAGCVDEAGEVPLDVAPLFETVADLDAAEAVVRALFADPRYRRHLAARGDRQIVMLGYSDSAKDAGLVASRWALQQTQIALTRLAREAGIGIVFFHGRGGSASRGGGKTERAVIASPRGSVGGHLRLTEQGEVIHRKYGIRALALRNLEQMTGAVLRATLRPRPPESREPAWRTMATLIAAEARRAYRELVHDDAQFADYFRAATPIDVIERLRIGSRPSRRGGAGGIDRLRAIPWVFAWSQNRAGLTGWYGVGSGLAHGIATFGREPLAEMMRDWPFFAQLVDDVEMVLAKSDLAIFERYSRLAGDLHAPFFARIGAEFERTRTAILDLKGEAELLAGDLRLRQSIRLRNPYVDPISLLQVDLLARWRAAGREDEDLLHGLIATVNGISAGIQNTG